MPSLRPADFTSQEHGLSEEPREMLRRHHRGNNEAGFRRAYGRFATRGKVQSRGLDPLNARKKKD